MWLLLFHSSVSEHKEDADQQPLQGEREKRTQPSAEASFQPKRQCPGKRLWPLDDLTKTALLPGESQLAPGPVVSLDARSFLETSTELFLGKQA